MEQQVGKNRTSLVTFLSTSIEHGSKVGNSEKKNKGRNQNRNERHTCKMPPTKC